MGMNTFVISLSEMLFKVTNVTFNGNRPGHTFSL